MDRSDISTGTVLASPSWNVFFARILSPPLSLLCTMRPDETTRDFFVAFYKELRDSTVQKAFDTAVRTVETSAATFSLLPKSENSAFAGRLLW